MSKFEYEKFNVDLNKVNEDKEYNEDLDIVKEQFKKSGIEALANNKLINGYDLCVYVNYLDKDGNLTNDHNIVVSTIMSFKEIQWQKTVREDESEDILYLDDINNPPPGFDINTSRIVIDNKIDILSHIIKYLPMSNIQDQSLVLTYENPKFYDKYSIDGDNFFSKMLERNIKYYNLNLLGKELILSESKEYDINYLKLNHVKVLLNENNVFISKNIEFINCTILSTVYKNIYLSLISEQDINLSSCEVLSDIYISLKCNLKDKFYKSKLIMNNCHFTFDLDFNKKNGKIIDSVCNIINFSEAMLNNIFVNNIVKNIIFKFQYCAYICINSYYHDARKYRRESNEFLFIEGSKINLFEINYQSDIDSNRYLMSYINKKSNLITPNVNLSELNIENINILKIDSTYGKVTIENIDISYDTNKLITLSKDNNLDLYLYDCQFRKINNFNINCKKLYVYRSKIMAKETKLECEDINICELSYIYINNDFQAFMNNEEGTTQYIRVHDKR